MALRTLPLGLGIALLGGCACDHEPDPTPTPPSPNSGAAPPVFTERADATRPAPQPDEPDDAPAGPAPERAEFEPATRGAGACEVTVTALLEAQEYRGPGPMTPAIEASLAADPEFARMYQASSHGDHHIQCIYRVELAHEPGKRYRWREIVNNTLQEHTAAICNGLAAEVAEDIIRTTKSCTDLDAGAYYGQVLEPMA